LTKKLAETNILFGRQVVRELMHSAFAESTIGTLEELYHYGIKGQKWGVRRTPEQLGHPNKRIENSFNRGKIKNASIYKKAAEYGPRQIAKSIRSFEKQITTHQDYLKNPEKHVPDWKTLTDKRRKNYINHWKEEIRNFKEQRVIMVKAKKGD